MASAAGGRITAGAGASLVGSGQRDRVPEATCYLGNLEPRVTEEIVWELFMQCGPVVSVYLPKDRVTNEHQGYGFVEFKSEQDADYAIKILNMLRVYDKPIKVNKSAKDRMEQDVGANLFVGNLDPEVDEKYLYDTFSAFGVVTRTPKVMRDPDTGESRGFGFVSFATFEASDAAIEAMNGQFLSNRPVSVMYAYKKDSRGERHGTPAERLLAQRNRSMREEKRPHTLFAAGPGQAPQGLGIGMPPGVSRMPPPPPPAGMAGAFRGMPPPPPPPHMMMYNGGGPPPGMMGQGMPPPPPPPGMMGQGMPPPPPPPGMMGQGMPPPPPPPEM